MQTRHICIVLTFFLALLLAVSFVAAQGISQVAKNDPFAVCVKQAMNNAEKCLLRGDPDTCTAQGSAALDHCQAQGKSLNNIAGSATVATPSLGGFALSSTAVQEWATILVLALIAFLAFKANELVMKTMCDCCR